LPVFSDNVIALARDELRYHQRGDAFQCATMRSHGKSFVLVRTNSERGRPGMYAIDQDGRIYQTQIVDQLISVIDEPDVYHFED
jgi:hypothetical protein